jgi:hypothetical protein
LVERAPVTVEVVEPKKKDGGNNVRSIDALAGENLRRLLQRKYIKVYDSKTKRFDMPFATGKDDAVYCISETMISFCLRVTPLTNHYNYFYIISISQQVTVREKVFVGHV